MRYINVSAWRKLAHEHGRQFSTPALEALDRWLDSRARMALTGPTGGKKRVDETGMLRALNARNGTPAW